MLRVVKIDLQLDNYCNCYYRDWCICCGTIFFDLNFDARVFFPIWILMHECFFIILNPGIFSLFPCLFLFFLCFYSIDGITLLYVKQIMSRIWDITYMKIILLYSQQETNVLDKEILPKFSDYDLLKYFIYSACFSTHLSWDIVSTRSVNVVKSYFFYVWFIGRFFFLAFLKRTSVFILTNHCHQGRLPKTWWSSSKDDVISNYKFEVRRDNFDLSYSEKWKNCFGVECAINCLITRNRQWR